MTEQNFDFMTTPRVFVRVYRLPDRLTDGYCFGGGRPIPFLNVDWFEAPVSEGRVGLIQFIRTKQYFEQGALFLVLADSPEFTFTIGDMGMPR
jgi:hypothetical protein